MKYSIIGILVGLVAFGAAAAYAQPGVRAGGGGFGPQGRSSRMYDPKTVETVSGEVVEVDRVSSLRGMGGGVHLVLRTDGATTLAVHLGPAWYVDDQDVKIAPKDRVEVKGSRVTIDGKPAIIAAEVKKGAQTLVLRNDAGIPAWSRAGRRGRP